MAKRAVKKSGKKTKARRRNTLAASGRSKATKKAVGARKKTARKAAVKRATRGAKQARKSAAPARKAVKKGAKKALRKVATKAAAPLPKKKAARKKQAARAVPKPHEDVGVREVQTTVPATPVAAGEAPAGRPLQLSELTGSQAPEGEQAT